MNDEDKVIFDVDSHPNLAASLVSLFDSRIIGGKRYARAAISRRLATDITINTSEYVADYIDAFKNDTTGKINQFL